MSAACEDSGLLRHLLAASDAAAERDDPFEALVRVHTAFLFKVAYAVVRNRPDAEDCVQDAFLKVHRGRAWARAENPRAFLACTVFRIALDRRRSVRSIEPADEPRSSTERDPEESALAADAAVRMRRLVDALPEDLRQPLVLSSLEEMSSPHIGEMLGIPEATVRNRILRARQLLKQKWEALEHGR